MKPVIFFLPLEPLDERYTAQMLKWVEEDITKSGYGLKTLKPVMPGYLHVRHGQWLDTFETTRWRNAQMTMVADVFEKNSVRDGDIFLFGDVWYPGIEAVRLIADLTHVKIAVAGWHYAGTADPADLLHRELGNWGGEWEKWLVGDYLDAVCVGSHFHKGMIVENLLGGDWELGLHIHPLGLAWHPQDVIRYRKPPHKRERIVVFPHRLALEKNPKAFYDIAKKFKKTFPKWKFVVSTNNPGVAGLVPAGIQVVCHASKHEYYEWLSTCAIYYSAATQETFGYALHEAIALGLGVVAPARCSYVEGLQGDERFMYNEEDLIGEELLAWHLGQFDRNGEPVSPPIDYTTRYSTSVSLFLESINV